MATGLGSSRKGGAALEFSVGGGTGGIIFHHVSCFVRRCSVKHRNLAARLFILKKMFKKSSFKCQKHIWNNVYQFLFNAKKMTKNTKKNTKMHLYTHVFAQPLLHTKAFTNKSSYTCRGLVFAMLHPCTFLVPSTSLIIWNHIFATQNNPLNFVPPLHEFIWLSDVCFQINGF